MAAKNTNERLMSIISTYKKRLKSLNEEIVNSYPTTLAERQLRLQNSDKARTLNTIIMMLSNLAPDTNRIFKFIEATLKSAQNKFVRDEYKALQKKLSTELIPESDYIGITELSDPAINMSWVARLKPKANIIITKNVEAMTPILLQNKNRIILHATCTGLGSTIYEPNVPHPGFQIKAIEYLIQHGFPKQQIVHRLDPIILSDETIKAHMLALQYFSDLGISRCRYSFCDFYEFVRNRFTRAGIPVPQNFSYSKMSMQQFRNEMIKKFPHISFESCCEPNLPDASGCISQKDLDILGVSSIQLIGTKSSRRNCLCPMNKFELIRDVPGKCGHNCIYCFWKRESDNINR